MSSIFSKLSYKALVTSLVLLLCLGNISTSFSQSETNKGRKFIRGYVIKKSGEQVYGSISFPGLYDRSNWILFREDGGFGETHYTPLEITEFGSADQTIRFKSIQVAIFGRTDLSFVRMVIDGPYDAFLYKFLNSDHILLQGPDLKYYDILNPPETLKTFKSKVTIPRNEFKAALKTIYQSDPEFLMALSETDPTASSIIKAITNYYSTKGLDFQIYGINSVNISAGFSLEGSSDVLTLHGENEELKSGNSYVPAVGISIGLSGRRDRLSVLFENTIGKRSFHYYSSVAQDPLELYIESFDNSWINKTRLGISANMLKRAKFNAFLSGGGAITALIDHQTKNYLDLINRTENIALSTLDKSDNISELHYGFFIQGGITYKVFKQNSIRITGGYETQWGSEKETISSVRIGCSYIFKIR